MEQSKIYKNRRIKTKKEKMKLKNKNKKKQKVIEKKIILYI